MLLFLILVGLLSVGCLVAGIWIVMRNYNWAVAALGILLTVAGALLAFVALLLFLFGSSEVTPENQANQVSVDHGLEGLVPPWVDPETGIIDMSKVPDRMPVADGSGGTIGYIAIDKDPNDDLEPGDPGFDEWNTTNALYDLEEGGNLIGHLHTGVNDGTDGGTMIFVPLDGTPGPVGSTRDNEELPPPTPGN